MLSKRICELFYRLLAFFIQIICKFIKLSLVLLFHGSLKSRNAFLTSFFQLFLCILDGVGALSLQSVLKVYEFLAMNLPQLLIKILDGLVHFFPYIEFGGVDCLLDLRVTLLFQILLESPLHLLHLLWMFFTFVLELLFVLLALLIHLFLKDKILSLKIFILLFKSLNLLHQILSIFKGFHLSTAILDKLCHQFFLSPLISPCFLQTTIKQIITSYHS